MTDAEKIRYIIDNYESGVQRRFADKTGLDRGAVSRILSGKVTLSRARLRKIYEHYPDCTWLVENTSPIDTIDKDELIRVLTRQVDLLSKLLEQRLLSKDG